MLIFGLLLWFVAAACGYWEATLNPVSAGLQGAWPVFAYGAITCLGLFFFICGSALVIGGIDNIADWFETDD